MKAVFKNAFFTFLFPLVLTTVHGQFPMNSETIQKALEREAQELADAKKTAGAAKILILGNSYQLFETTWLLLGKMSFNEQADYLKGMLYADAKTRASAIDDASREVYGAKATSQDFAYWDAKILEDKKDWYATIVLANSNKLNADKEKKELTIRVTFVTVFGREPSAVEITRWVNSKAHYRIIYQNLLAYMYSADGAFDLNETVKRSFAGQKILGDDQVKERMMKAKEQKMDFLKMVDYFK